MSKQNGNGRKKKVIHIKETKAKVHIGTQKATISLTIPISKIVAALGRRHRI
jgi:hypothetical protein